MSELQKKIYNQLQYIQYLQELLSKNNINYQKIQQFNQNHKSQQNSKKDQAKQQSNQNVQLLNLRLQTNMSQKLNGSLVERYSRQMLLKQISYEGQQKIVNKKIAIIGCGGIGCPLAMYLAGAGVGNLGLFDSDVVDVTNLHRQIGHKNSSLGIKKTTSLKQTLLAFNPYIKIIQHEFITVDNSDQLNQYDMVIDGSDNPQCRYIVNDYCMKKHIKLLSGACIGWEGQITCYGGQTDKQNPCYRCIWGNQQKTIGGCSTLGVVGMLPGVVGIILAVQAIKMILNQSSSLQGYLLTYDAKNANFRKMKLRYKLKQCIGCGQNKLNMKQYDYSKHAICKPNLTNLPVVPQINWPQYLRNFNQNLNILDVRPSNHFNICHLKNMISLPYESLVSHSADQIQQFLIKNNLIHQNNKQLYISCNRGIMSKRTADYLIKLGYSAISIKGGITEYSKEIDKTVPLL